MVLLLVCLALCVAVPVAWGAVAHRRPPRTGGPLTWGVQIADRLGAVRGTVAVLVTGYALTLAVGLALGHVAKALEDAVDQPVFGWVHPRVCDGLITRSQEKLTLMGNNADVQVVVLVAGVVLACAYGRRWWLPVLALLAAYWGEKYAQTALADLVDRGHPPTTLGTYPSGGVGRILAVYGTVVVLILVRHRGLPRAWRTGLWTGVATAAGVEAFTRVYLSKHWLTDAVFALPFGTLLLLTNATAVATLVAAARPGDERRVAAARRAPVAGR